MAMVMLTWELGGGLGHLMNLLPLAQRLSEKGHRVVAVLKDLSRAREVFAGVDVRFLQAPIRTRRGGPRIEPPRTFAHILHNSGFGNADGLRAMTDAWRALYLYVQPNLVVFDHSPTALLAARGHTFKKALIGSGFFCPPDESPLPDLRRWLPADPEAFARDEARVLENANGAMCSRRDPPLARLAQLHQDVDANFLTTFPELDPYPRGDDARYWGVMPGAGGQIPVWPEGRGPKIYAYLKPFPALPRLLAVLRDSRYPCLISGDGLDPALTVGCESETLRFADARLNMQQVADQCDLAVLNGNHGTTAAMLLAGKPVLELPILLEQLWNSRGVVRLGAGVSASPAHPAQIERALQTLFHSTAYSDHARRFAAAHAGTSPEQAIAGIVDRLEALLYRPSQSVAQSKQADTESRSTSAQRFGECFF